MKTFFKQVFFIIAFIFLCVGQSTNIIAAQFDNSLSETCTTFAKEYYYGQFYSFDCGLVTTAGWIDWDDATGLPNGYFMTFTSDCETLVIQGIAPPNELFDNNGKITKDSLESFFANNHR